MVIMVGIAMKNASSLAKSHAKIILEVWNYMLVVVVHIILEVWN